MKILLISANREKIPYPVAPLGLMYVAHAVKAAGHRVDFLDLCFEDDSIAVVKNRLDQFKPQVVGISIRNADNLSFPNKISYLPDVKKIVEAVRETCDIPVVLGGSAFSLFAENLLEFSGALYGIVGEGEEAFTAFLNKLENKQDLTSVPGLIIKDNKEIKSNPPNHSLKSDYVLDRDYINNKSYMAYGGMGNIQAKRGCVLKCIYCTYPLLEGSCFRLRSPDVIASELKLMREKYGITHAFFVDNIFNLPNDHAAAVCQELIERKVKVNWSCFVEPSNVDLKLLELMKRAGCTHIEFGSDSLSDRVLKKLGKPFTVKEIMGVSKLCKEVGIDSAHYIMFGSPGENKATVDEIFSNIGKLDCNAAIAMVGIRIYPNTGLQKLSIKEGLIVKEDNLIEPKFYLSPKIDVDWLLKEISKFAQTHFNFVVPGMGIKSSSKLYSTLRKYYKEGPLWGYFKK